MLKQDQFACHHLLDQGSLTIGSCHQQTVASVLICKENHRQEEQSVSSHGQTPPETTHCPYSSPDSPAPLPLSSPDYSPHSNRGIKNPVHRAGADCVYEHTVLYLCCTLWRHNSMRDPSAWLWFTLYIYVTVAHIHVQSSTRVCYIYVGSKCTYTCN